MLWISLDMSMLPGHEQPNVRWPCFEQGVITDVSKHPCCSMFVQKGEKAIAGISLRSVQANLRLRAEAEEAHLAVCCADTAA